MDLLPYVHRNQGLPGRFAWGAAAIGIIGLLLVSLIIWVERLEATAPDVETGPPIQKAAPCSVEPSFCKTCTFKAIERAPSFKRPATKGPARDSQS